MIELKITGSDIQSFYNEAVNALALLARGAAAASADVVPAPAAKPEPVQEILEPEKPAPVKAKAKKPVMIDVKPEQLDIEQAKPVEVTDDQLRQRIKDIIAAHTERGHDMATCVAYVKQLYAPFEVKIATALPADKRVAFMKASDDYLAGTA